jgi:DNA-binding NtrC family response regulator
VRELKHVIESAMAICEGDEIEPGLLRISRPVPASRPLPTLEELEREHIRLALDMARGNRAQTARILGISERNLYRKLSEYKLAV